MLFEPRMTQILKAPNDAEILARRFVRNCKKIQDIQQAVHINNKKLIHRGWVPKAIIKVQVNKR